MRDSPISDEEALRRIKSGEIDYFAHVVNRHIARIRSFVRARLYDKDEADDLVQNVFVSFYKAVERIDGRRPVLPYLFEIARNELKMFFRSHKASVPLDERMIAGEDTVPALDADELLKGLPEEQRRALGMVYEGYSYEEIADRLGKKINTVRTIIRRARLFIISKHTDEKTGG